MASAIKFRLSSQTHQAFQVTLPSHLFVFSSGPAMDPVVHDSMQSPKARQSAPLVFFILYLENPSACLSLGSADVPCQLVPGLFGKPCLQGHLPRHPACLTLHVCRSLDQGSSKTKEVSFILPSYRHHPPLTLTHGRNSINTI